MPAVFKSQPHTIDIAETDLAGLTHFSHYLCFVESAERQFLTRLNIPVITRTGATIKGFPRRHSNCDYTAPIRFNDQIQVELSLERIGEHSILYHFKIIRLSAEAPIIAATGELAVLYAEINTATEQLKCLEIPEDWKKNLAAYLIK